MNTFGDRVASARERIKLRQTELAERAGVTPGAINKIESGESKGAKPSTLAALARALGVSMEWLVTGKEGYVLDPASDYALGQMEGYVLDPASDYALGQMNRLLAVWEGLPLHLRVPLLKLMESMAGVEDPPVLRGDVK